MEPIDLSSLPLSPGIYLFKDASGRVVYVGKAKQLRKRVSSYFRQEERHTPKTRAMLRAASQLDTLTTTTEKEALLLEASLIKKHRPRYNIVLRDDKQYVLYKLTKRHDWPRLVLTRKVIKDGSTYFGPFTSAYAARQTWKAIHAVFKLRRCTDKAFGNRVRPCLYHHIGQCYAPCCVDVERDTYLEQVQQVEMLLSGRSSELVGMLREAMLSASDALEFERAAMLRDQIDAVEKTVEQQAAVIPNRNDMDVLGLAETEKGLALGILFVRRGILLDKKFFFWGGLSFAEAPEVLVSFLTQYYGPDKFIPSRIVLPWNPKGDSDCEEYDNGELPLQAGYSLEALSEVLTEMRGAQARVVTPRNDVENRLVSMAAANALEDARGKRNTPVTALLARRLALAAEPWRIEVVDVSHTSGKDTRVGMVVFEDAKPAKDQYRTYAFADEDAGGDDYGVLAQWMTRRIESGPPWPDLLLIDGGRGQLGAVMRSLKEAGMEEAFAVASIAKARDESGRADRHKGNVEDRIFLPNRANSVNIPAGAPELLFLQHMRDTVHDFAIGRHRKARSATALSGELLRLPGVGPALAKLLWGHFGSLAEMAAASEADLAAIPGIGKKKAAVLREGLQRLRE